MRPRARVDTTFKVLEKNEPRETRTGKRVTEAVVGDDSGTVLMTLWEETIGEVDVGKTYTITNGYANLFRGSLKKRYEDDRGFGRSYGERSSYGRRPYRRRF